MANFDLIVCSKGKITRTECETWVPFDDKMQLQKWIEKQENYHPPDLKDKIPFYTITDITFYNFTDGHSIKINDGTIVLIDSELFDHCDDHIKEGDLSRHKEDICLDNLVQITKELYAILIVSKTKQITGQLLQKRPFTHSKLSRTYLDIVAQGDLLVARLCYFGITNYKLKNNDSNAMILDILTRS